MDLKHSKLGIASFLLSCAAFACTFLLIAFAMIASLARHAPQDARQLGHMLFALGLFALVFANLVSLGLGIAGLCQAERKKLFAVLGTVFACLQILGSLLFVIAISRH